MLFEITCDIFLNNKQRYQWQHCKYFQIPWVPRDKPSISSLLLIRPASALIFNTSNPESINIDQQLSPYQQ